LRRAATKRAATGEKIAYANEQLCKKKKRKPAENVNSREKEKSAGRSSQGSGEKKKTFHLSFS